MLDYEDQQSELVSILQDMKAKGLMTISLKDQNPKGTAILLSAIDPFTFFANFNRGTTHRKRIGILRYLKERLSLHSAIPSDFNGIPVVNNMQSWFVPWAYERNTDDIPSLWKLARAAITQGIDEIDADLFAKCLTIHTIGIGKLSMGLFWMNPKEFISVEKKNKNLLKQNGIDPKVYDLDGLVRVVKEVKEKYSDDFAAFSREAHLRATGEWPPPDDDGATTDARLRALFEKIAQVKNLPKEQVAHWLVNHKRDEFNGRKTSLNLIKSVLERKEYSIEELSRTVQKDCYVVTGFAGTRIRIKAFFEHEDAKNMLDLLIGDTTRPPSESSIDNFMTNATTTAFLNPKGKKVRSDAGLFASTLLSAVYPAHFVDFRRDRWTWAANVFVLQGFPQSQEYGEMIVWAGQAARKLTETETFREYFKDIEIEPLWSAAALIYLVCKEKELRTLADNLIDGKKTSYWIFQGNPDLFDIDQYVRNGETIKWRVTKYRGKIAKGDKVILWRSGDKSGAIATADVLSKPAVQSDDAAAEGLWKNSDGTRDEKPRCDLRITKCILPNYLPHETVKQDLPEVSIVKSAHGTNYKLSKNDYETLIELMKNITNGEKKMMIPLNLILYGPPGTGKTYSTVKRAVDIADGEDAPDDEAGIKERFDKLMDQKRISYVTFHQSFSYEDFVEGIRPVMAEDGDGGLRYECRPGIFREMCERASSKAKRSSVYSFNPDRINFFKMSLGNTISGDDDIYNYCLENNVISLGWGGEIDYSGCSSKADIRTRYIDDQPAVSRFGIEAVPRFKDWIHADDIVMISKGNHQIRAIAKVVGDYAFDSESPSPHNQFRKVEWLYKDAAIPVSEMLVDKVLYQQTLLSTDGPDEKEKYVLIIDEINRGNISKILGELITLLEPDKRQGAKHELQVTLPYSQTTFGVPSNLYVIGTMNTADKSIALMDVALRRRFVFEELMPNFSICTKLTSDMRKILNELNDRIKLRKDRDHQIGHSYFIEVKTNDDFNKVFGDSIIPLLQEYFWNDWEGARFVLGEEGKESGQFICKIKGSEHAAARNKWQWFSDVGVKDLNFLSQLQQNYKMNGNVANAE